MDRETLRALQAPLKERYRESPEAAVVTLAASGTLDDDVACNVHTAVVTAVEIDVASGTISAEGELDLRGTLAVDRSAPVGARC